MLLQCSPSYCNIQNRDAAPFVSFQQRQQGLPYVVSLKTLLTLRCPDAHKVSAADMRGQFRHSAQKNQLSAVQDADAAAQAFHLRHIMAGQDDGFPLRLQCADLRVERHPPLHVQPGCGFIQKYHVRPSGERKCKMQPPLLSGGQRAVLRFFHPTDAQCVQHGRIRLRSVPFCKQRHGLHGPDVRRQRGGLKLYPGLAPHHSTAAILPPQALDAFQRRGLSRAVHPQQRKDLALLHREGQSLQHRTACVTFLQALHPYRTAHCISSPVGPVPIRVK